MCDTCERVKKELSKSKKILDTLTKDKDLDNPINIDMVKTEKAMCYQRIRTIYKKESRREQVEINDKGDEN
jgi:hypothetical protein